MKKINELYGEAYNTAINNVIQLLNDTVGTELFYARDWAKAEDVALKSGMVFDLNGEFTRQGIERKAIQMAFNKAQYDIEYQRTQLKSMTFKVKPEVKERINKYAELSGMPTRAFIMQAVEEKIQKMEEGK